VKLSSEQLMQATAKGDLKAFDEIVLRHQRAAWNVAHRFLGDPVEAEDVAQEAFLRILEAAPRYQPTANFRTYLYRVVTHLCLDRSKKMRPALTDHVPDVPDDSPGPDKRLVARERQEEVRTALDALPPHQRMAIILRHYEGLNYTEIALATGTTVKAVEGLLGRGRTALLGRLSHLKDR
jgi:RNA polymerase sigma-70 factor (ECF subfamily)